MRPALGHFIAAIICGAIYGVSSGLGVPFLLKTVLPVLFGDDKHRALVLVPNWHGWVDWPPLTISPEYVLAFAVALLPTVFAIRVSAEFANKYLLSFAGLRVLEGVRVAVFSRLQELHLDYFRRHKAGDLISRIMVDTNHVKTVIVDIANDFMIQPFTFVSAIGFIGYECFKYPGMERFLIALAAIPAVVVPVRIFGKKLLYKSEQMLSRTGGLSALLAESLQSPREIRAYNLEANERRRFSELVRGLFRSQMKMVKYEKMLSPLIEFLSAVSISVAVYQAAQVDISQGDAVALIGALYFAYEPVKKLSGIHNRIKSGLAGLTRLEEVLNAPVEVADPAVPVELGKVRGEVSLDAVTFAYGADSVLSDVSVKVHPGEVVALVGPSGAGKSTFVNLVLRFYDPQQGTVHVDGTDVRKVRQAELREAIALVSQEPILFNDTIYNNILLGRRDATREAVEQAAEQAGARDFIEAQPGGWDAVVGERGGQLSGGQRQRVAIARAFLKNSPILILDEATSALDAESEAVVQQALEKLVRGKTTFIIAHRFSTIRFATRILVFDKGRVVADGPHAALLESCPLYRTLYARQMAGT